jgi:hypothetical protein
MTGGQKLIIGVLGLLVAIELCVGAYIAYTRVLMPAEETAVQGTPGTPTATPTITLTFTPAPIPTNTFTPTPVFSQTPTPTPTRVVVDTATPTITPTPTETSTPTPTVTATYTRVYRPAQPTSPAANGFQVVASTSYTTTNHFFVMFAQIKVGGGLAAGYRIQGTHQPSGLTFESAPSCWDLCKASGPRITPESSCNEWCTPEWDWDEYSPPPLVQEGNVVFEAPIYDTGLYEIRIINDQGQPVSDVFPVPIDANDRRWFFYVFNR